MLQLAYGKNIYIYIYVIYTYVCTHRQACTQTEKENTQDLDFSKNKPMNQMNEGALNLTGEC